MKMKVKEFDIGPNAYGYYFIDYNLNIAALAINPDVPQAAKETAFIQGIGHTTRRPPKEGEQFILDDREIEDLDPNAILCLRSVIEDLRPSWVKAVKDACRLANHPRVIGDWCDISTAAAYAIIENLKARGEIPDNVGHSDVL